jgi:nucleotide-binding universal stress UspA family protein
VITLKEILVPTDFSEASDAAFEQGRALAAAFGARVHLLHVVAEPLRETWAGYTPAPQFVELLERLRTGARTRLEGAVPTDDLANRRVVVDAVWGDPSDQILKYATRHGIDLIVCGTCGRGGWDHLLMGSVAERIVRLARCPVLTLHGGPAHARTAA